ncbi:hypothetical protein EIN43_06965 [Enterobacter hormaechei]|uniref:Lipoprotein n=1 Tax=Enterobacter hormaechei TaxID=158836 RepID=A0A4Y5ZNL6_9ENTR|nr:hypothetical protein EIN43_06965 [Enterobacter hormaechei]
MKIILTAQLLSTALTASACPHGERIHGGYGSHHTGVGVVIKHSDLYRIEAGDLSPSAHATQRLTEHPMERKGFRSGYRGLRWLL